LEASSSKLPDDPPSSLKCWTLRKVVKEKLGQDIDDKVTEMSGAVSGTPEYLAAYPRAWTHIVDNLSEEEKEKFEELAEKWNKAGPPIELRQK
jgi:hypothetical protein